MFQTAQDLLRTALNDSAAEFRDGQWHCIEALLRKRRVLVVQRTGWGKSMVYFIATRMLRDAGEGFALLISPLLALMRNQVLAARRIGIRAATINSANREDWDRVRAAVTADAIDILLISPERLANDEFREDVLVPAADRVGLFVVDEAHCISDWGHDFRPDYRRIVRVLRALPGNVPVLGTTATANDRVVADVAAQLGDLEIEKTLKYLSVESPSPVSKQGPRWYATAVAYSPDRQVVDQLCRLRRSEQEEMRAYMQTGECLMRFLARALDDPHAADCGRCANCVGAPLWPETVAPELANAAALFLRRSHQAIVPRKMWPAGALPVYGFRGRVASRQMAREGRALCLWGDAGWGRMVHDGKYRDGRFDDALVDGCLEMIGAWRPQPTPAWVTAVPSLTSPELVPDFARRLAAKLAIPFVSLLRKVRANRPQKEMENSFQQAGNLDGVFALRSGPLPPGPVLLVDDMVDSGWTFTVLAALLGDAGCPAVHPLALAVSSRGNG